MAQEIAKKTTPTQATGVSSAPPAGLCLGLGFQIHRMAKTEAAAMASRLRAALEPAGEDAAIIPLTRLAVHYWQPDRPEEHWDVVIADFRADLAKYPPDIISDACKAWRTAIKPPNRFFPKPGEFIAMIEPRWQERYRTIRELEEHCSPPAAEWVPPTEAERVEVSKIVTDGLRKMPAHLRRSGAGET